MLDIVFMGTPEFAIPSLEAVIDSGNNLKCVITQPDRPSGRGKKLRPSPVKKWAMDRDLAVYQPENINTSESIEYLKGLEPDLIVTGAFGQILSKAILDIPAMGCINVHASILPKYRGASPIQQAIIDGQDETGITIMYMAKGMDTGDIILCKYTSIGPKENAGQLHDRLASLGRDALSEALALFKEGRPEGTPQDNTRATYCKKIHKALGEIDWNMCSKDLNNLVRGLTPWPGCFTFYSGERLKIWRTGIIDKKLSPDQVPGEVILSDVEEGLIVACGDGAIRLHCIQGEGGKPMEDTAYLMGNPIPLGSVLGR